MGVEHGGDVTASFGLVNWNDKNREALMPWP